MADDLQILPLTSSRWPDLVALFGTRGEPSWCWCSWLRVPQDQHGRSMGEASKAHLEALATASQGPGLIAYRDDVPVGWVSVAPRRSFVGLVGEDPGAAATAEQSDPTGGPVWSVTCFVVRKDHRGSGVAVSLLGAAVQHARREGARVLEGYPTEPGARSSAANLWTGVRSTFEAAGFTEAGRFDRWGAVPAASGPAPRKLGKPPGRPVMRLLL